MLTVVIYRIRWYNEVENEYFSITASFKINFETVYFSKWGDMCGIPGQNFSLQWLRGGFYIYRRRTGILCHERFYQRTAALSDLPFCKKTKFIRRSKPFPWIVWSGLCRLRRNDSGSVQTAGRPSGILSGLLPKTIPLNELSYPPD